MGAIGCNFQLYQFPDLFPVILINLVNIAIYFLSGLYATLAGVFPITLIPLPVHRPPGHNHPSS